MICANPKCGKEFTPNKFQPKQKYCSVKCRKNNYYANHKFELKKKRVLS